MTIKGVEITAKAIMTEAWAIARKGQAKFGGKVSSYIREAMRMAWSEAKRGNRSIVERIDELTAMGFKRWQKNGMDRMYINASTLGLRCEYYKTGNVRNGESFRIIVHPLVETAGLSRQELAELPDKIEAIVKSGL